ncbi:hypothetical protein CWI42_011480 [Ordospora colligata]|uniref:Uncharacterized protein n=1 Tax=Ordospora colligata OC4 TaxID=1354746 RepID=A0A0B2UMH9_9MICR|nr:uncharacterized protein M896_011480 [Ordospora colligata OC4]KHN70494.1 hypothetical protein M896_011480 [Ordospora colligata OC4]TBU17244.1 hypothetical protein CWI41_011480 [Ordospora colligata]TBU17494.1 hypothetical protein CWI40_011480 [Ordospora colligata]TBU19674.1 hypothetical protein CWI42_011480 [Ordospora colligata]
MNTFLVLLIVNVVIGVRPECDNYAVRTCLCSRDEYEIINSQCRRYHVHELDYAEFLRIMLRICTQGQKQFGVDLLDKSQVNDVIFLTEVFGLIFDHCNSRRYEVFSVATIVMYNTSYLYKMQKAKSAKQYKPRGIFQLSGVEKYEMMDKVGYHYNGFYVKTPEILGRKNTMVVEDSIRYWMEVSRDYNYRQEINILTLLKILNPKYYQMYKESCLRDRPWWSWNWYCNKQKIEANKKVDLLIDIYNSLIRIFKPEPRFILPEGRLQGSEVLKERVC